VQALQDIWRGLSAIHFHPTGIAVAARIIAAVAGTSSPGQAL
jgi:hypothetical protein